MLDYILNGQGSGNVAAQLLANDMDSDILRPFIGEDNRAYINKRNPTTNADHVLQTNSAAYLRKDDWLVLDQAVLKAAKPRLRAVADLMGGGLQYTIPNGMGKTVLQYERQSDISLATIAMDGAQAQSESDRPIYDLNNLPLPIIYKDFSFPLRQVAASRNGGSPLDTTVAELAARRVTEEAEKLLLGTSASYTYGGGTVYGYTNFPARLTKTMTTPTGSNAATTIAEVLDMRQKSQNNFYYGPWMLYTSIAWDAFLDNDYILTGGNVATQTLRERLAKIDGISGIRTLDYLTGYQMIMVQMTPDVVREVVGMNLTTVQWETQGGMMLNFKVMCIMVPQLRSDIYGNTGIVHGSV